MKKAAELLRGGEDFETARPRWKDGLVLLCSKCSGQQHDAGGPETMPSWDTWQLRCWLKKRMCDEGLWPKVRVLTTSCMGICHDGMITAALGADAAGAGDGRCMVLDPERDAERLLELIRESLAV